MERFDIFKLMKLHPIGSKVVVYRKMNVYNGLSWSEPFMNYLLMEVVTVNRIHQEYGLNISKHGEVGWWVHPNCVKTLNKQLHFSFN